MLTIQDFERRFCNYIPSAQDTVNTYAVLVPLVEREGEFHLLFEVRSDTLRRQPSEVCFPGGKIEGSETARSCAVRETTEELGIPPSSIRLIGDLDYIAHHSNIIIYPVLARIDAAAVDKMTVNSTEVKDTFLVPLSFFRTHPPALYEYDLVPTTEESFPYEQIGFREPYSIRPGKLVIPIYEKYRGYVVWGMTGRIVRWLMESMSGADLPQTEGKA